MFFTSKKIFLFLLISSNIILFSSAKKVSSIELEDADEIVATKSIPKKEVVSNNKSKAAALDYEGKQIIFGLNKDYVFNNSSKAKDEKGKMNEYFEAIQAELFQKHQEIQKQQSAFEQKRKTVKPEALAKEEEELGKKAYEFQRWQLEQQQEIKEKEESLMKDFLNAINEAIKEFCNTKGNEKVIVLAADTYIHSKYDASEAITSIMNRNYESQKKAEKSKDAKKETKKETEK